MASFWESIDALKEAGLANSEIFEIMSESVDGQILPKNLLSIKSPVKNFLPKTMIPLMKFPQSEREKLMLSAPKNNPKQ